MKQTIIYYEKKVDKDGIKRVIIKDWANILSENELPKEYVDVDSEPQYYTYDFGHYLYIKDGIDVLVVSKGDSMSKEEFEEAISIMKKAGNRLRKINSKISRLKKKWEDNKVHKVVI